MFGHDNYINSKIVLYCILTTTLILRFVTLSIITINLIMCRISNVQVEILAAHDEQLSLKMVKNKGRNISEH